MPKRSGTGTGTPSVDAPKPSPFQATAQAIATQYLADREVQQVAQDRYGRLSRLAEPDTLDKLFTALADGNYPSIAAQAAGINPSSFKLWMKRADEEPDSVYCAFSSAVKEAEAAAESAIVRRVRLAADAGPQYWAAGMTLLERRAPERWGKRMDNDSSGPKVVVQIGVSGNDVQVTLAQPQAAKALTSGTDDPA